MTIRVFLVDDHPLFLAGLRDIFRDGTAEVIGESAGGPEALRALRRLRTPADVVLMGLEVPDDSALALIRRITVDSRVLIVSDASGDYSLVTALRAGAGGFLVRSASRLALIRAVHTVADGGAIFGPEAATRLAGYFSTLHALPGRVAFPHLTERERQILDLLARGYDNWRIARELVVTEKTVRNHVSRVLAKLRVGKRTEAAILARNAGLGR